MELNSRQNEPTSTRPLIPNLIPTSGTIPRCTHGVYLSSGSYLGRANYCQACTPEGPHNTRSVVLPRWTDIELETSLTVYANGKAAGACPECGSRIHTEVSATQWACAECGTKFKASRAALNEARLAAVKKQAEEEGVLA